MLTEQMQPRLQTTLWRLYLIGVSLFLAGCDTIYGVRRAAAVHAVPDLGLVKAKIESYPEITEVKESERDGGRLLTLTGIKPADRTFYLSFSGDDRVRGTLMFVRNYKGEVLYDQSLIELNSPPPQRWVDATWPVMKRIERDLEEQFGLPEIRTNLKTYIWRVADPDRPMAGK
jgi:hypothetical protein